MTRFFLLGMLMMSAVITMAQNQTVNGKITDEKGLALPFVNISVKGTLQGVVADNNGNYTLEVADKNATMVFSFIGYSSQEIEINGKTTIDVVLKEDLMGLDEVIVVGYGTVKKSDATGAVVSLKSESLEKTPATSVDQLLQGKSAGLVVYNTSGEPGAGVSMRIRGSGSLYSSNDPLYVVDGFPIGGAGALKHINPQDIESIEVLKDASSAAIYGSRGANGVIMITTKKGKKGKSVIEVNIQESVSELAKDFDIITDPLQYAIIDNEAQENAGLSKRYIGKVYEDGGYYPSVSEIANGTWNHKTNWQDKVYRTARTHNFTVSARGGSDKTTYSVSLNHLSQEGIQIENKYEKTTAAINFKQEISSNVNIGTNINIAVGENKQSSIGDGAGRSPVFPVYGEGGEYYRISGIDYGNPIAQANEILAESNFRDIFVMGYFDWQILPELKFRSQLGAKFGHSIADSYLPRVYSYDGDQRNGVGSESNYDDSKYLSESYFTFNKELNELHSINATLGYTYEFYSNRTSTLTAEDFINDVIGNEDLNTGAKQIVENGRYETKLSSLIGRVNYSFNNKYLFTFTSRYDGSSKFGSNNKWAFFPSGAVSWKMHEESFIKDNIKAISNAKLRLSYGMVGEQGIGPYQTLDRYGSMKYFNTATGKYMTGFGPGYISSYFGEEYIKIFKGIANPSLKWETTTTLNTGFDLSLLGGKYNITMEYYQSKTKDLLRDERLPTSAGYDWITVNDGEIENKGFEFIFDGTLYNNNDFQVDFGFNFAMNENKVVSIGELKKGEYEFMGGDIEKYRQAVNVYMIGQPLGLFYGYKTDGIIQTNDEGLAAGLSGSDAMPGELKYVDLNDDGVVDNKDWTVLGDPNHDFVYGVNLNVKYKGFDLFFVGSGAYGGDVFNIYKDAQASSQLQRWSVDNPTNEYTRMNAQRSWRVSDWFVEDGSYFKIQNISLGYNFNTDKINYLNKFRMYVSCQNVHTFSDYSGYDAEAGGERGLNWGSYPKARTYTLGVNVAF